VGRRDVFVSYSQPDRDAALELVSSVESHGIECWVAPRDIAPAADWAEEIIDAITAARVMVLVFSASANASPQVRREVERAVHKGVTVLPVRIEDVLPAKSLEYFLSTQHWLDAFPAPRAPHYARLCAYLSAILAADTPHALPTALARASATADAEHALDAVQFDATELRRLELELARFVGPLAKHLVKRAASQALSIKELVQKLGGEIESEEERRKFTKACQQVERSAPLR
jgi:TIR domain